LGKESNVVGKKWLILCAILLALGGVFLASSSASGAVRGVLAFADYLPIVFNGVPTPTQECVSPVPVVTMTVTSETELQVGAIITVDVAFNNAFTLPQAVILSANGSDIAHLDWQMGKMSGLKDTTQIHVIPPPSSTATRQFKLETIGAGDVSLRVWGEGDTGFCQVISRQCVCSTTHRGVYSAAVAVTINP
jgi:hypothetical protein